MKKRISHAVALIALIAALITAACERSGSNEFVINNQTNHTITILGYNVKGLSVDKVNYLDRISISPDSEYSISKRTGYQSEDQGVFSSYEIDSVVIIFDEIRKFSQYCGQVFGRDCALERNIMNYQDYYDIVKTGRSCGGDEFRYTYTITEEDYNNASIIDGK